MYGYTDEDFLVNIKSPFDVSNRLLMIADNIQTTYNKRNQTSDNIVEYIIKTTSSKVGNYMVFFPSYKYMELVYNKLMEELENKDIEVSIQSNSMTEKEKEDFLDKFNEENNKTHIGFCVLGGHFSEGIDLTYDKLIGVIIVGVGMPQIGIERDIIKEQMNENNNGFDYAYVYPGITKVLQAAGRCIRTDEDRGVIMLIDSRYSQNKYRQLFPYEWYPNIKIRNSSEIKKHCDEFWINDN